MDRDMDEEISAIADILREIVKLLVIRDHNQVDLLTGGKSGRAVDVVRNLEESKVSLIQPPDEAFEDVDYSCGELNVHRKVLRDGRDCALKIRRHPLGQNYYVDFDVWTSDEVRSDYTLQLRLMMKPDGGLAVSLESIHVL